MNGEIRANIKQGGGWRGAQLGLLKSRCLELWAHFRGRKPPVARLDESSALAASKLYRGTYHEISAFFSKEYWRRQKMNIENELSEDRMINSLDFSCHYWCRFQHHTTRFSLPFWSSYTSRRKGRTERRLRNCGVLNLKLTVGDVEYVAESASTETISVCFEYSWKIRESDEKSSEWGRRIKFPLVVFIIADVTFSIQRPVLWWWSSYASVRKRKEEIETHLSFQLVDWLMDMMVIPLWKCNCM